MKTLKANNREALLPVLLDLKRYVNERGSTLSSKEELYRFIMRAKWPTYYEMYMTNRLRWKYCQKNWEPIMYWLENHDYIEIKQPTKGKQSYTIELNTLKLESVNRFTVLDYKYGVAKDIVELERGEMVKEDMENKEDMVFECKVGDVVYDAVFAKGLTGKVINDGSADKYSSVLVQFAANCFRHYTADGRAFDSVIPTLSHAPYSADLKLVNKPVKKFVYGDKVVSNRIGDSMIFIVLSQYGNGTCDVINASGIKYIMYTKDLELVK